MNKQTDDLLIGKILTYKDFIAKIDKYNIDKENEVLVKIYATTDDYNLDDDIGYVSLNIKNIFDNIRTYIDDELLSDKDFPKNYFELNDYKVVMSRDIFNVRNDIEYVSFILGTDLLKDIINRIENKDNDQIYTFCYVMATEFTKTDYYKNNKKDLEKGLNEWVCDNKKLITRYFFDFIDEPKLKGKTFKNGITIIDSDYRNLQPIALVEKRLGNYREFVIAYDYEVKDDEIVWKFERRYGNIERARKDFDYIVDGGDLSHNRNKEEVR